MKRKHLFTYFGLATLITASLIIISCQKEQTGIYKQQTQTEQSLKDAKLEKRIVAFRDKIDLIRENPTLKSGTEPMEIDSAVWYIEATSNYTYGNASASLEDYIIDSSYFEVTLTNGKMLFSDIQAIYDKVIDSLSIHYARIVSNEKQLLVADISLKESDGEIATIQLTSGFGINNSEGLGNNFPWYWGWELGRCDGSGLGVGKDAADIIKQLANFTIGVPIGNSYYTDVEMKYVYPCEFQNSNGQCLTFEDFQEYTLNHQCLSTTEINFYKNGLVQIGNLLKPVGKSVISYHLFDDTAFGLCGSDQHDCWYMGHFAEIKYAIWHTSSTPPHSF